MNSLVRCLVFPSIDDDGRLQDCVQGKNSNLDARRVLIVSENSLNRALNLSLEPLPIVSDRLYIRYMPGARRHSSLQPMVATSLYSPSSRSILATALRSLADECRTVEYISAIVA